MGRNYSTAAKWYEKAAASGNAKAERNLGSLYLDGKGVTQDRRKAEQLFLRAARKSNAKAMHNLG